MEQGNKLQKLLMGFVAVLIVIYAVNILSTARMSGILEQRAEETRPAELELTGISADCENCFSVTGVLEELNNMQNVKIIKESRLKGDSEEAQELMDALGIKRLPTLVFQGEVSKDNIKDLWGDNWAKAEHRGKEAAYLIPNAPYEDMEEGGIKGLVKIKILKGCEECGAMEEVTSFLRQQGVVFSERDVLDYASGEAKKLIEVFGIKKAPAIIATGGIQEYKGMAQILASLGAAKKDGSYVIESLQPPYRNLSTLKIEGMVKVVYLNDSECSGCYDVLSHKPVLQRFGISVEGESFVDVSSDEGKRLIAKYKITDVPTILLSADAGVYPALKQAWLQVGTIEEDGYYVFRNVGVMGDFRDLGEEEGE